MSSGRHAQSPEMMKALRLALPVPTWASAPVVTQARAASLLGTTARAVKRWEKRGTENSVPALAYVALAFDVGGADAARKELTVLRQREMFT